MTSPPESSPTQAVHAAICVDADALDRFGRVLRHLAVGLVDQAVQVRFIGDDARVQSLRLGPIQATIQPRTRWLRSSRGRDRLLAGLASDPPTIVHAMSRGCYEQAMMIAREFEADLVLQVGSLADAETIAALPGKNDVHVLTFTRPLAALLADRFGVPPENVEVIAPGVTTAPRSNCFAHPQRIPTILCTVAFDERHAVERLVEAAAKLRAKEPTIGEFQVFLLGTGRHEAALRRAVRLAGLSAVVTFAPPLEDLETALESADLFVRPVEETAFHSDTLQAMGSGMAVITQRNETVDYLRSDETGVVIGHGVDDLVEAIQRALSDRANIRRLAANGLEYVRQNHGIAAMAERTAASYRNLALARTTFSIQG